MITNEEIAHILNNIAEYLAMEDVPFKPRAYEKAAMNIEALDESVFEIYKKGGIKALEDIPAVGRGIAEKIEELLKTGKIKDFETGQVMKKMRTQRRIKGKVGQTDFHYDLGVADLRPDNRNAKKLIPCSPSSRTNKYILLVLSGHVMI